MYDTVIIGGGLSGLLCGIRCAEKGQRVLILSAGMNTLHFSSGSIQLMSRTPGGASVTNPFTAIEKIQNTQEKHPYARIPKKSIQASLTYLTEILEKENILLAGKKSTNTLLPTSMGTLRPVYLSQSTQYSSKLDSVLKDGGNISVINIEGYRDFHEEVVAAELQQQKQWKNCTISHNSVKLPVDSKDSRSQFELRSHDISQILDKPKNREKFTKALVKATNSADLILVPALFGLSLVSTTLEYLKDTTGKEILEIPTVPPSIPGMRLDRALRSRFLALGGQFSPGERVTAGSIKGDRITHIQTKLAPGEYIEAENFVLATGSFISDGLIASRNDIYEPVFNCKVFKKKNRKDWARFYLFSPKGHPFIGFGVETDKHLRALNQKGEVISNLFCAGSVLGHYDPVREGSGGGVAVSSAYHIAEMLCRGHL